MTRPLPLSVVLPTRNAMPGLAGHLTRNALLFEQAAEVVHCDSGSQDGTVELVRSRLGHRPLQQLSHPPGLYASWNHAIAATTQPFVQLSTVGDDLLPGGAQRLLDLARSTGAQIVVSPPRLVREEDGGTSDQRWPIHRLIERHGWVEPGLVAPEVLFFEAVVHAPDSLLGSAASCLFEGEHLRRHPFPVDFAGIGDSVWALERLPFVRCAVLPEVVSTFLLHRQKTYESHGRLNAHLAERVRERLEAQLPALLDGGSPMQFPSPLAQALVRLNRLELQRARLDRAAMAGRDRWRALWPLVPSVWTARRGRKSLKSEVAALAESVRRTLTLAQTR